MNKMWLIVQARNVLKRQAVWKQRKQMRLTSVVNGELYDIFNI